MNSLSIDIRDIIENYLSELNYSDIDLKNIKKDLSYLISEYTIKQNVSVQIEYKVIQFEYNIFRLNEYNNNFNNLLNESNTNKVNEGLFEKNLPTKINIVYLDSSSKLNRLEFNLDFNLNESNGLIETLTLSENKLLNNKDVYDNHTNNNYWFDENYYKIQDKRIYPDNYEFKL